MYSCNYSRYPFQVCRIPIQLSSKLSFIHHNIKSTFVGVFIKKKKYNIFKMTNAIF